MLALLIPSVGIAVSDVVIDALMVEKGQRYGMTGRFQSIQWAAIYAAPILTAPIGGYLAAHGAQRFGFLICGVAAAFSLTLLASGLAAPYVGRAVDAKGPARVMAFGALLAALGARQARQRG